jgi:hypothetical protein
MKKSGPNWKDFYRWKGMVVKKIRTGTFLQKLQGQPAEGLRKRHVASCEWPADASMTPC